MSEDCCVLYHMRLVGNVDLNDGYIGVCSDLSKRKYKHFDTPVNHITKAIIESGFPIEFVVLLKSNRHYCLEIEKKLRPETNMGWNVKTGGNLSEYPTDMKEQMSIRKIGNKNVGSGKAHHFHGKIGKDGVRYGTRGAKNPNHIGHWVTPFGTFESMSLAGEHIGVATSTIFYRCVTSLKFDGWYFKPLENNYEN